MPNALWKRLESQLAKHYYNIELVTRVPLDEDEVQELEDVIKKYTGDWFRVSTEYIDSEG